MYEHLKFKHPFTCIVAVPTGSGKTSFCIKLLHTESKFKEGIIWWYSEATAVPHEQLSKLGKCIKYQEGLPYAYGNDQGEPLLIILDDLLNKSIVKKFVICSQKAATTEILAYYCLRKTYFIRILTAETFR